MFDNGELARQYQMVRACTPILQAVRPARPSASSCSRAVPLDHSSGIRVCNGSWTKGTGHSSDTEHSLMRGLRLPAMLTSGSTPDCSSCPAKLRTCDGASRFANLPRACMMIAKEKLLCRSGVE